MNQHYRVSSIFRDRTGRTLRHCDTFNDMADGPRYALTEAHKAMVPIVEADPRIDSISSTCKGSDGEMISTTDYADELGCGTSSSGLVNEIDASMLDGRADTTMADALDLLTDAQKEALADAGKTKEVAASGAGTFPAGHTHGKNVTDELPGLDSQGAVGVGQSAGHDALRSSGRLAHSGSGASSGSVGTSGTPGKELSGRSNSVRRAHGPSSHPVGAPYQGNDIMGDIIRAVEDMGGALGPDRAPTAIRLGQSAHDALVKEMEAQNRGLTINGPIVIAGVPVVLHNDPNMAPIQIEVGRKRDSFDMMGLNPGQRNHIPFALHPDHPLRDLVILDEAEDIDPTVFEKLRSSLRLAKYEAEKSMYDRLLLGKWEDENE